MREKTKKQLCSVDSILGFNKKIHRHSKSIRLCYKCRRGTYGLMPRKESLGNVQYNRYYEVEAIVRYSHEGQKCTTAVLEEEGQQKRIRVPKGHEDTLLPQQQVRFPLCFSANNGWLYAKQPSEGPLIQGIGPQPKLTLTIPFILEHKDKVDNTYVDFVARVLRVWTHLWGNKQKGTQNAVGVQSLPSTQTVSNSPASNHLSQLQCLSDGILFQVLLWNTAQTILPGVYCFSGFKVRDKEQGVLSFNSGVYSNMAVNGDQSLHFYNRDLPYTDASSLFKPRTLLQLSTELRGEPILSEIECLLSGCTQTEYMGCSVCRKGSDTPLCPDAQSVAHSFFKVVLQDGGESIEAAVFKENVAATLLRPETIHNSKRLRLKSVPYKEGFYSHVVVAANQ